MDWITGIQRALDYIEAQLTGEIGYEKAASPSYMALASGGKDRIQAGPLHYTFFKSFDIVRYTFDQKNGRRFYET